MLARLFTSMFLFILVCKSQVAVAEVRDYGQMGQVFEIAEPSLLDETMAKLDAAKKDGSLKEMQKEFTERVKKKVLHPNPVIGFHKSTKDRSWTYNPSYTQGEDILDNKGRVVVAAGTKVNALEFLSWGEPLLFIDGADQEQVKWASGKGGKIVLTNGAPLELTKKLNRRVYFDQGGILCHHFRIEAVPAIIEQEGNLLKVSEVAL